MSEASQCGETDGPGEQRVVDDDAADGDVVGAHLRGERAQPGGAGVGRRPARLRGGERRVAAADQHERAVAGVADRRGEPVGRAVHGEDRSGGQQLAGGRGRRGRGARVVEEHPAALRVDDPGEQPSAETRARATSAPIAARTPFALGAAPPAEVPPVRGAAVTADSAAGRLGRGGAGLVVACVQAAGDGDAEPETEPRPPGRRWRTPRPAADGAAVILTMRQTMSVTTP